MILDRLRARSGHGAGTVSKARGGGTDYVCLGCGSVRRTTPKVRGKAARRAERRARRVGRLKDAQGQG